VTAVAYSQNWKQKLHDLFFLRTLYIYSSKSSVLGCLCIPKPCLKRWTALYSVWYTLHYKRICRADTLAECWRCTSCIIACAKAHSINIEGDG
jgi:hypothetical protein